MKNHSYISMQQDMPDQGQLQVTVLDSASNRPVENATVRISYTGVPDNVIGRNPYGFLQEKRPCWS